MGGAGTAPPPAAAGGGEPAGSLLAAVLPATRAEPTDAELREALEFRTAVSLASPDIVSVFELASGRILFDNGRGQRLFGDPMHQAPRGPHIDQVHPDDRPEVIRSLSIAADAADDVVTPVSYRYRVGGDWRWLSTRNVVFRRDSSGRATQLLGVTRDVTVEHEAASELAAREAAYRLLAEHTSDLVVRIDADGRIGYVSPACRRMLGYEPDELMGTSPVELIHPADLPADYATARDRVRRGAPAGLLGLRLRHRDGYYVWTEVTVGVLTEPADDGTGVSGAVVSVRDVTDRHRAEDELLRLALHDPLTGLANRALLADRATLALSRRGRGAVALFLLDLDRFKMVNDTLGHHAGDELLLGVAQRLALAARPSDTVARVGGDEFVVLCEDLADAEQAAEIAARLLTAVRDPISLLAGSERVEVRTSIGIAACPRGESTAVGELLRRADLALYRAKQAGRDRFAMFDEELHSQALARMKTEQALRRALGESGLRVHYQPILLLSDDRVTAAEALIRMHDPSGRPVAAAEFIEIAEDSGTITEIDCFVLEDTLRHLDRWPSTLGLDWVAVNVAARTMAYPGLLTRIGTAILSSPDVCQHLVFELTERTLLDTETGARAAVDAVRELGVSLAVDDFGTGYSALSYLQTLPLRIVKLDKALIAETVRTARAAAVAAAMVDLAHAIGLLVVAEGVERPDELAMVRRLGCDYAQGYLIGRPAPADAFAASVR